MQRLCSKPSVFYTGINCLYRMASCSDCFESCRRFVQGHYSGSTGAFWDLVMAHHSYLVVAGIGLRVCIMTIRALSYVNRCWWSSLFTLILPLDPNMATRSLPCSACSRTFTNFHVRRGTYMLWWGVQLAHLWEGIKDLRSVINWSIEFISPRDLFFE